MFRNERPVNATPVAQQTEQTVQQRQIRLWSKRQMPRGVLSGARSARIGDDDLAAGFPRSRQYPIEGNRMTIGRIGADEEKRLGFLDVLVTGRRPVASEG